MSDAPPVVDRTDVASRSTGELALYMREQPCPRCGSADTSALVRRDAGAEVHYLGPCPACGAPREFRFRTPPAVLAPKTGGLAPGAEPSQLFDRDQLVAIADRALAAVAGVDDATTDLTALTGGSGGLSLAVNALVEAGKFDGPALADRIAETRTRRDAVEARRQTASAAGGYVAVDRNAIRAHEQWARTGRTGAGRISARGANLVEQALRGANLSAIQLTDSKLDRINLSYAELLDAELTGCSLTGASLVSAQLPRARLRDCTLRGADLRLAVLKEAQVDGGDWREIAADRGGWDGARLRGVDLRGSALGDVVLDDAQLTDCDLRDAQLARVTPSATLLGSARNTRFTGCDLRNVSLGGRVLAGVVFERCRLAGLTGKPILEGSVRFVDCEGGSGRLDGGPELLGWK